MIIDLQRRLAEVGRIRIGQQVPAGKGKTRPEKLTTFRLTSSDRTRIQQAAQLYGGTPAEWEAPSGKQWEVITTTDALNVIVPPSDMAFTQHYELWSGGGCQRRCDGVNETITDGPCLCDPDKRECQVHTRLSVMLADLPGLGVWRIDSQGWNAALELQGAVEVVRLAAGRGQMLPARLRLDQRMTKRPGQGTRRFAVPVLDIEVSPAQLLGGGTRFDPLDAGTAAVEARRDINHTVVIENPAEVQEQWRALTPVPETVPEHPIPTVAEQAAAVKPKRRNSRSAQPIPSTGLLPRTVEQVASGAPPDTQANTAQNRKMHALFRELRCTERADRLAVTSYILGHNVDTSRHLTSAEASKLIDTIEGWQVDGEADATVCQILNWAALAAENQQTDEPDEGQQEPLL